MYKITLTLMTGAGIGIDYSDIRPEGKAIRKTGGFATGPLALMQMVNEAGRGIVQGGSRRSAIWAGLSWKHQDVHKFITMKNWTPEVRAMKEKDFNFPATMDGTNISVLLDDEFFKAFHDEKHKLHSQAQSVYWATVKQMCKTAEPGFSIDVGENAGETLRNACTEITSTDDSDICNLGSINLARIDSLDEMRNAVELGTAFLLAGTVYSDVPFAKID
jgi:ribonucleoside-diphosphate reductase alpha chain